ncbi:MAG: hypothetical protein SV765_01320 [Pseudomonadota bacterium]|nr:hypothetical protein [Pseudomonadales bacterium]MDY6918833.1 hypothetical protein [Pseudomonadota bacterium]
MSLESRIPNPGSSSLNPDLDWSQIKETISMLCLAMAQIETTLTDSSRSVDELSTTFTGMAQDARKVMNLCEHADSAEKWETQRTDIMNASQQMHAQMQRAIVAFQFYDRLTQKLHHVNESLSHLGDLIGDSRRLYDPGEWNRIQKEIRSNYTMECERLMFDHIMQGATITEALELYRHQFEQTENMQVADDTDDDIELF